MYNTARIRRLTVAAPVLMLAIGCATPYGRPGQPADRLGDEIMVAGRLFHTGAPVVLWTDAGGYDAYRAECRFTDRLAPRRPVSDAPIRYGTWRRRLPAELLEQVRAEGWTLPTLQQAVTQFVLHYDVCGYSRRCFEVLHDLRGLSVHFMLDIDGTIYQTLDVKERAWHAGTANDRSVGIEIANIGAYPNMSTLNKWYATNDGGEVTITLPDRAGDGGLRTPSYVGRPSGGAVITGEINGRELMQYDLTDAQYDSLVKLTATLCTVLPEIRVDYPRDADGTLRTDALSADELSAYTGLIGHYHITTGKSDPGPAFDWERLVAGVKKAMR